MKIYKNPDTNTLIFNFPPKNFFEIKSCANKTTSSIKNKIEISPTGWVTSKKIRSNATVEHPAIIVAREDTKREEAFIKREEFFTR